MNDEAFIQRAHSILHRLSLERRGWRGVFRRWCHHDEPLRNDAARLILERGYDQKRPINSYIIGEKDEPNMAFSLHWHPTGPSLKYDGECLHVEDLNPHIQTKWRMSRWEMVQMAFRTLFAAARRYKRT